MLVTSILAALLGAALLAAAALKAADRTGTAVAAETFGLRGRAARHAWLPLTIVEAALAGGVLAGAPAAAWATAGLLGIFAAAQAIVIAAGRAGAPCGCFGSRGAVTWGSVARTAALGATAVALAFALAANGPPPTLPTSLAALVVVAAIVLRARRPTGALEIAEEGPPLGSRPALGDGVRLALFVADGCHLCRTLIGHARRRGGEVFDERADAGAWAAAAVPGAPFAVALAPDGSVLAKGTVNTRAQLDSVVAAGRARGGDEQRIWRRGDEHPQGSSRRGDEHSQGSSRRGFLGTAATVVAALTAGRTVGALVAPGDADAFHFCGHIYTTDGCPHPTGLPRIDSRGLPLRAQDGQRVDDLGRPVDEAGAPVDDDGDPLLDPDGRRQPPATRTRVCAAAGRRFEITVRTDGSWFRCCDGHVRKLIDCCTTGTRRINGDRALRGYCYGKRKVFCVMYYQTRVPC